MMKTSFYSLLLLFFIVLFGISIFISFKPNYSEKNSISEVMSQRLYDLNTTIENSKEVNRYVENMRVVMDKFFEAPHFYAPAASSSITIGTSTILKVYRNDRLIKVLKP